MNWVVEGLSDVWKYPYIGDVTVQQCWHKTKLMETFRDQTNGACWAWKTQKKKKKKKKKKKRVDSWLCIYWVSPGYIRCLRMKGHGSRYRKGNNMERGCGPSHGRGLERRHCPSPYIFFLFFGSWNAYFGAFGAHSDECSIDEKCHYLSHCYSIAWDRL